MSKMILIVDDSPTEQKAMQKILEARGYSTLGASDGEQALEIARREKPALILLDVVMPKLNGFQVCRQLKADDATKEIKVILVTSKAQETDRFWGMKQGADDYVVKPYDEADLLAHVKKYA